MKIERCIAIALLAVAQPSVADDVGVNLSFERLVERDNGGTGIEGWNLSANGSILTLDGKHAMHGEQSLLIAWREESAGNAFINQPLDVDAVRGKQVTFGGWLQTEDLDGDWTGLFMQANGDEGILRLERTDSPDPRGSRIWTRYEISAVIPEEAERVVIGAQMLGEGKLWIDDLYLRVEEPQERATSDAVNAYLEAAFELMQANSINRDEIDWDELRAFAYRQLQGAQHVDETYGVLRGVLAQLGDRHSFFWTANEYLRRVKRAPTNGEAKQITPSGKILRDRVAYISVPRLLRGRDQTKQEYASILQRVITRAHERRACGYVLDLRENSGGFLGPMLLGLAPVLGRGVVGGYRVMPDDERPWVLTSAQADLGGAAPDVTIDKPARILDPSPPVALLTGPGTRSSAEAVVIAFEGRENVRSFGADTYGVSTSNQGFALPDQARLFITNQIALDRTGRRYGGAVPVDVEVEGADRAGHDDAVAQAAVDWLLGQPGCR